MAQVLRNRGPDRPLTADTWTVVVLYGLGKGPVRHGELIELIGGISRKVLIRTLRRLEAHGFVRRQVYAEVPRRVEYELTSLGATLIDPIHLLSRWRGRTATRFSMCSKRIPSRSPSTAEALLRHREPFRLLLGTGPVVPRRQRQPHRGASRYVITVASYEGAPRFSEYDDGG
ncbi:winged helix-turn-helix transcriptional regulator [Nocardia vaccinii]|uniref:winged helix-turn-helix transcriptional regulator n=1 Tax=Nocardia vaccinii TaxID=1822 RepID=UPI000B13D2C3|nr:helix-turn-helix domain-containing protein [Nocardia vaccinii]